MVQSKEAIAIIVYGNFLSVSRPPPRNQPLLDIFETLGHMLLIEAQHEWSSSTGAHGCSRLWWLSVTL